MKLKLSLLFFLISSTYLFGVKIITANKDIGYNESIKLEDVYLKEYKELPPFCKLFNIEKFKSNDYHTKHFIGKDSPICSKDIEIYTDEKVLFDFGNIQIEKKAKVIYENDEVIKIKEPNGNVEKIYKNGRIK